MLRDAGRKQPGHRKPAGFGPQSHDDFTVVLSELPGVTVEL